MCRMSSSRLPGKALAQIRGKPVIQHIIERAKLLSSPDVIVLCTSTNKRDDVLEAIAKKNGIEVFRGSLEDVLERLLGAACQFGVDYFINYTADNIFCDPGLMDLGISQMIDGDLDFINLPDDLIVGGATYCIATKALKKVCQLKDNTNTESYPQYFTTRKEFKIADLKVDDPIFHTTKVRTTIDYPEDFEFARVVFDEFNTDINRIPLKKILELLKQKPEIGDINFSRQKDWAHRQKIQKKKTGPRGSRSGLHI
jgi:spore coat polysaccharide biosynthesis protein SpsF